jgi:hypothetical protein
MNYKRQYDNIISRALLENRKRGEFYYEMHHIVPKCLGGLNNKENLVLLTAKEHYVCHHLLYKLHPHHRGIVYSFWRMSNRLHIKITSTVYENLKILNSKFVTESNKKRKHTKESKDKISKSKLSKSWGKHSKESKDKISKSNKGKPLTDKRKENISKALSGEKHMFFGKKCSEQRKESIRKARLKTKKVICPHCKKEMDPGNAKKHHFDNCKYK